MNNLGLILLAFMALVLVGCAQEELVPLEQASRASAYVDLKAQFCVDAPTPSFQKMRYLFITDHSSSNKPGFPDELTPEDVTNMDPEGRRRYGPLADFIRNLEEDPFQLNAYALVTFNSTARPRGGGFESDSDKFMQTVVNTWIGDGDATYPSPVDSGFTNYQAALEQARELIRNDAEIEAVVGDTSIKTVYNVILVTDGVPTVARNGGSYTQDFDIDLLPVIQAIMDVQDDPNYSKFISHITLNTAYYFGDTPSSEAISLLGKIADAGNGRYLQFGSGRNVLYQQFTPPHRLIKNQLVDVLVDNLNSRWWIDGTFRSDRDGDGLPDFVEIEMGSDPLKADSDGNGVSDFVEYKLRGVPCAGESCEAELAAPYAMCDGLDPR